MKPFLSRLTLSAALFFATFPLFADLPREASFDADWRFLKADAAGAEKPEFDDSQWRTLEVPHDWSIEDLPEGAGRVGPFDPTASQNQDKTGYTVGGTGWYRKHFKVDAGGRLVSVRFDGVYMNAQVWINGHLLGAHPSGYTSFEFDLTPYLKPGGADNVLAVQVRNEGKNSRWYSGSGIYRHVWLTTTQPVHVPTWGLAIKTPEVTKEKATVRIKTEVYNASGQAVDLEVRAQVIDGTGAGLPMVRTEMHLVAKDTMAVDQAVEVPSPALWSPDSPRLYQARVEVVAKGSTLDEVSTSFGIRKIEVDAVHGLRLNGEPLKLKGGCVHQDNGPLGVAALDRAEERRVELLKAAGFNAIRCAHNPPSPAFLDACDRLGMLVIDEAFDQWNRQKMDNAQDYHLYFKDWAARDIAAMVRRDRNHPSVIMWSIGNEIPEQFKDGERTAKMLRNEVLASDTTRPITQAVCGYGKDGRDWDKISDPAFVNLDVGGYNYLPGKYESDHARHPERVMMATESFPKDLFNTWAQVEQHPYVIGDFVWTAMDYFGESGIGHSVLSNGKNPFFMSWPWHNGWCGDLDGCGFKKAQSDYRDVVWKRRPIAMEVHSPIPAGLTEKVSEWGWPDEAPNWNWPGQEGKPLQVAVYTRCDTVRLELNGKVIGEKPVSEATLLTVKFDVPYAPGELRALGLTNGKVIAQTVLKTTGAARRLKLTADRSQIHASRDDLSYVTVEVVDENGLRVPDAKVSVHFSVGGTGELAAQGNGSPNEPASFREPVCTTFQGRCLAILRPTGGSGSIILRAAADGLDASSIVVQAR